MRPGATAARVVIVGGGQSGLAAARAARDAGMDPIVLEAGTEPTGSWPHYYDSLRLFSPSEFSGFPGYAFPGLPGRYPARDEVTAFLRGYASWLGVEIRTDARVEAVTTDAGRFLAHLHDGGTVEGDALVAASGSFANPHEPTIPGRDGFAGETLHVADYRSPLPYAGKRVVVVGAGNSAVQVGHELSHLTKTTLAVRTPVQLMPQTVGGRDVHYWFTTLRLDLLPAPVFSQLFKGNPVVDLDGYRDSLESGRLDQRPMFTAFTEEGVVWADGTREPVDVVIFATGYRPAMDYLRPLGALTADGAPRHDRGVSLTHPRLGYLGLEFQRSFSSNTLRGVHRDASHVIRRLEANRRIRPRPRPTTAAATRG